MKLEISRAVNRMYSEEGQFFRHTEMIRHFAQDDNFLRQQVIAIPMDSNDSSHPSVKIIESGSDGNIFPLKRYLSLYFPSQQLETVQKKEN